MKSSSFFPRKCTTAFRPCCIERMEICLAPAGPAERDTLYRLLQYSLYEESAYDGNQIGEDALFPYPWFDAYFMGGPSREGWWVADGVVLVLAVICLCGSDVQAFHAPALRSARQLDQHTGGGGGGVCRRIAGGGPSVVVVMASAAAS